MINLSQRSYKKEILDSDNIAFAFVQQNMQELNTINSLLGGHAITIDGIKEILNQVNKIQQITICEIGCGGGDNLNAINTWCQQEKIKVNFIGIDIKEECLRFAKKQYAQLNCRWIASDYKNVSFDFNKPTIIFSSLFCHHFKENELVSMLKWMKHNAEKGFFINDLHRHWLAYYSIKFITYFFSKCYLVKNDAPLSVARGFKQPEWQKLLADADLKNYTINWKWAFRYLIVHVNE